MPREMLIGVPVLLWAALLAAVGTTRMDGALRGDVVANGGFEADAAGADGWILVTSSGGSVVLDTDEKHSGTRSLRIVGNGPKDRPRAQSRQVEVTPGDVYRIALWGKLEGYRAGRAAFVVCKQSAVGTADSLWQGCEFVVELEKANSGKGWVHYAKDYVIPRGTHAILVRLWGEMFQGTAWFDEVTMLKTGTAEAGTMPQPTVPARPNTARLDLPRGQFYVARNGRDGARGTREEPWQTIQHAVDRVGPGSVIRVRAGVYHESVQITNSGTPGEAITLQGDEGERPVLDGEFRLADGVVVSGDHVRVSGLEIRNYLSAGVQVRPRTANTLIDHNVIHHISSNIKGAKAASESSWGIRAVAATGCAIRNNTIYLVVGRTESMGILFDVRSEYAPWVKDAEIRNNLIYLCDKAGIRFADYTSLTEGGTDSDSLVQGNICIHNAYVGLETNGIVCDYRTVIRDNFAGWNTCYGANPKQSHHCEFLHNTFYRNQAMGFLYSGEKNLSYCRAQGNLLVGNVVGSWVQTDGTDNTLEGNFYVQQAPWLDVFCDRTRGWGTLWKSIQEVRESSKNGYEQGGRQGTEDPFVDAAAGDFRVKAGSAAAMSASDGTDFGASAEALQKVGADERWGLGRIPLLNAIPLKLARFSSELGSDCTVDHYPAGSPTGSGGDAAKGFARHLVDGSVATCWAVDPKAGGWVEFGLPGEAPVPLSCATVCSNHTAGYRPGATVRDFTLWVKKAPDADWERVRDFVKQQREEGQIFLLPEGTSARWVKLEVRTNHGDPERIEVAEFRVYGEPLIR